MAKRFWLPAPGARHDHVLGELMETAAAGLQREDTHLATVVMRGRSKGGEFERAFTDVGAGLSYWLYETTIVFLIWRAWVDAGWAAALDWTEASLDGTRANGRTRGESYDLAVFGETRSFVFEAKSWSYYSPEAVAEAMRRDVLKLQRLKTNRSPDGFEYLREPSKYLMLFGWENRDQTHDKLLCRKAKMTPVGSARFPAASRRRNDDQFIVTLFGLPP